MKVPFLLLIFIISIFANSFEKKDNKICVDYPKQVTKLSYKQLCNYGKQGCENIKKINDIQGLCNESKISECFSKKQWLTIEQFVNLDKNKKIIHVHTNTITSITNNSIIKKRQLCVETDKKTFTMSKEKFKLFKQLSPTVLDTLNEVTKNIITCIEKEISEKNLNSCMNKINKTTEAIISALIPSKVSILCIKDENNRIQFVWTKEKHKILIKDLKDKIEENKRNKKCLLKSDTLDQYATCLANKSHNKTELSTRHR